MLACVPGNVRFVDEMNEFTNNKYNKVHSIGEVKVKRRLHDGSRKPPLDISTRLSTNSIGTIVCKRPVEFL